MKRLLFIFLLSVYTSLANCDDPSTLNNILNRNWSNETLSYGLPPIDHCLKLGLEFSLGSRGDLPGLTNLFFEQGANCTGFIKDDGSLGSYGEVVNEYISDQEVSARFLNEKLPHITEACPNWAGLNEDERRHFWVWTFASIAWDESRCVPNRRNLQGSNGVAVGLLQMDEARGSRSWRGSNCRVQSVAAPRENLLCGLDIMAELLLGPEGEYRGRGAIFIDGRRNTSYWQKLRTSGGGAIGDRIRSYPLCQN